MNQEQWNARQRSYYQKKINQEPAAYAAMVAARSAYNKKWRAANKHKDREKQRRAHLKRSYGMSVEDFDRAVESQAGLCAICCEPMKPGRGTNVDHDHVTGRPRGLLCNGCNVNLAPIEDRDFFVRSVAYLRSVI